MSPGPSCADACALLLETDHADQETPSSANGRVPVAKGQAVLLGAGERRVAGHARTGVSTLASYRDPSDTWRAGPNSVGAAR
jgi:hypothetical protein